MITQEVESTIQGRKVSSTYTSEAGIRGMVIHMLKGQIACTNGAMIHKVVMQRCGHRGGTEGVHQQVLMHV